MPYTPNQFAVDMAKDPAKARDRLRRLLSKNGGDVAKVAAVLGVSKRSVYRYMNRLGIR